jgi:protein TonB
LPFEQGSQRLTETADNSVEEHPPDASLPTLVATAAHGETSSTEPPPDSADDAVSPRPDAASVPNADNHEVRIASEDELNPAARTDSYRPLVLAILERAKRYPLVAERWRIEGAVDIAFTIHPDGRLSDPDLIASSTHQILDDAALAIVRRVRFVPPPPSEAPMRFSALIQYQVDQ